MKIKASLLAAAMLLSFAPLTAYAETTAAETAVEEETSAAEETAAEEETAGDTAGSQSSDKLFTEDGWYQYKFNEDGNVILYAFNTKGYMGEIVIPSEIDGKPVVRVENSCFSNSFNLTSVVIPASVESVGVSVFFGCSSLESIVVAEDNTNYIAQDGVLLTADGKKLVAYPANKAGDSYEIPDTVESLSSSCFAYAKHLKHVAIPDSIDTIPTWAFSYSDIESVTMADSVLITDAYCFAYCKKLAKVDLGNGMDSICDAAFANCTALTEITLPESLVYIGQYAFVGTGLHEVTIPVGVEEIEYCAFGYNEKMFAISDFVVRGYTGSAAQNYCSAMDEDNDYQNDFVFLALDEEKEDEDGAIPMVSEADRDPVVPDTTEAPAVKKEGNTLGVVLGVCAGAAAVLAAVLIGLVVKKPKKNGAEKKEEQS